MRRLLIMIGGILAFSITAGDEGVFAVPPLVTGDVPTVEKGHMEWFLGTRYQEAGAIERQVPFTELVYGISSRQEITFEMPYLSLDGEHGIGDIVLGTKYQVLPETSRYAGVAGSFEWKLKNGSQRRGLGTGDMDYDFRLRAQKTWGWFTDIGNVGYTFVGEPTVNGTRQDHHNVVFLAFAQEWAVAPKASFLSELYWKTSDEPQTPNRLAADVGLKYRLSPHLALHAAIGKSLREANRGGPRLRMYAGMKLEF